MIKFNFKSSSLYPAYNLFRLLPSNIKIKIFLIIISIILVSITELISLASIIPIINIFSNGINSLPDLIKIALINLSNIFSTNPKNILIFSVIIFVIFCGLIRGLSNYTILKFSSSLGGFLHKKSLKNYFNMPYLFKQGRLTDKLPYSLNNQVNQVVSGYIFHLLTGLSNIVLFLILSSSLILATPKLAFTFLFLIGIAYLILSLIYKGYLKSGSKKLVNFEAKHLNILNGIKSYQRTISISNLGTKFTDELFYYFKEIRRINVNKNFIALYPRIVIETIILLCAIIFSTIIFRETDILLKILPRLVYVVIVIQKILPLFQNIYNSWTNINANYESLNDLIPYVSYKKNSKINKFKILEFDEIKITNLSFSFNNKNYLFKNFNLNLKSGRSYHFIAPSGKGKSTLIDLLLGLIPPTKGEINYLIKGKKIKANDIDFSEFVSYVPQSTFFFDGYLRECLNTPYTKWNFSESEIIEALKNVKLKKDFEQNNLFLNSYVSNNISILSGGQKQRLAIAQALLNKNLRLLILDETLSMVDQDLSSSIINLINEAYPKLTIILISHDPSFIPDYFNNIYL